MSEGPTTSVRGEKLGFEPQTGGIRRSAGLVSEASSSDAGRGQGRANPCSSSMVAPAKLSNPRAGPFPGGAGSTIHTATNGRQSLGEYQRPV